MGHGGVVPVVVQYAGRLATGAACSPCVSCSPCPFDPRGRPGADHFGFDFQSPPYDVLVVREFIVTVWETVVAVRLVSWVQTLVVVVVVVGAETSLPRLQPTVYMSRSHQGGWQGRAVCLLSTRTTSITPQLWL